MENILKKAISLVSMYLEAYTVQRNLESTLSMLTEDVLWIGIGNFQVAESKKAVADILKTEFDLESITYILKIESLRADQVCELCARVHGEFTICLSEDKNQVVNRLRLSAICKLCDDGLKICTIHTSCDEKTQSRNETDFEKELRRQRYFMSVITSETDGATLICYSGEDYPLAYIGDNLVSFLGYDSKKEIEDVSDGKALKLIYGDDIERVKRDSIGQLEKSEHIETEFRVMTKSGELRWVLSRGRRIMDEDGSHILTFFWIDISQRKIREFELTEQSRLDSLTDVYNRFFMENEINKYLGSEQPNMLSALLILDLDNFKTINDTRGHIVGDMVLTRAAAILKCSFRRGDIVGRLGGDEFIVFMKNMESQQLLERKSMALCAAIDNAFKEEMADLNISISIGAAVAHEGVRTFHDLYACADRALYEAKREGKNTFRIGE